MFNEVMIGLEFGLCGSMYLIRVMHDNEKLRSFYSVHEIQFVFCKARNLVFSCDIMRCISIQG